MTLAKGVIPSVILPAALSLFGGNALASQEILPFRFEPTYEIRSNSQKGRYVNIGNLEKDLSGKMNISVKREEGNYIVDFLAKSENGLIELSYFSKYENSGENKNPYRSLEDTLNGSLSFGGVSFEGEAKYFFDHSSDNTVFRVEGKKNKEFGVSKDTMGLFTLLSNFFSGDCYDIGDHYVGKIKGNNKDDEGDIKINVSRSNGMYMAEMVVPEDVFWSKSLPIRLYYEKDGDVADINRVEVFVDKKLWFFDKWFVMTPVND